VVALSSEIGQGPSPSRAVPIPAQRETTLDDTTVRPLETRSRVPRWERRYQRAVIASDTLAVVLAVSVGLATGLLWTFDTRSAILLVTAATVVGTLYAVFATRSWDSRILGQGSEEFSRLLRAIIASAVILGMVGLLVGAPGTRQWVFGAIPVAGLLAVAGRYLLRQRLHGLRRDGRCLHPVLVVGDEDAVVDLVRRTVKDPYHGWQITGVCTPSGTGPAEAAQIEGVPVVGDLEAVNLTARSGGYRVVAVAPATGWSNRRLHQLSWDLEGSGVELVVQPGLMEFAGPRLHVAPVDGLPLLKLTEPVFTGVPKIVKGCIDRAGAAALVLLLAPVLLAIAVMIKLDGGGPVFFSQVRVGRKGQEFKVLKFRTMVVDAERLLADLARDNEAAGPLFKMRNDPRITRTGAMLRKYSLDELPQLFNVLAGSMSLVGPRPPLPAEVATYSRDALRKLLVKPGLTGLWQVSGRSDLSWEESVRLDLRYVESWTLALDALILWKTVGAVTRGTGAY
jgi:exopolysaccharide biosynthesis polyprenyl glycosylphosphotransferase